MDIDTVGIFFTGGVIIVGVVWIILGWKEKAAFRTPWLRSFEDLDIDTSGIKLVGEEGEVIGIRVPEDMKKVIDKFKQKKHCKCRPGITIGVPVDSEGRCLNCLGIREK